VRFLGLTPDGRRRYAADYGLLPPIAGGADPTSDDQVDQSSDDAREYENTHEMHLALDNQAVESGSVSQRYWLGFRFRNGPFPAQGSTIIVAYLTAWVYMASEDDANLRIHAQLVADPPTFATDDGDITGRARTDAYTSWVADSLGVGWRDSPSLVAPIQELVNAHTLGSLVLILKPNTDVFKSLRFRMWDYGDHLSAPKLHLEWTEGPPVGQPAMRRTGGIPGMVYTGRGSW